MCRERWPATQNGLTKARGKALGGDRTVSGIPRNGRLDPPEKLSKQKLKSGSFSN